MLFWMVVLSSCINLGFTALVIYFGLRHIEKKQKSEDALMQHKNLPSQQ